MRSTDLCGGRMGKRHFRWRRLGPATDTKDNIAFERSNKNVTGSNLAQGRFCLILTMVQRGHVSVSSPMFILTVMQRGDISASSPTCYASFSCFGLYFRGKIFSDLSIAQFWTLQLKSSNCRRQKCLSLCLQAQGQPFF